VAAVAAAWVAGSCVATTVDAADLFQMPSIRQPAKPKQPPPQEQRQQPEAAPPSFVHKALAGSRTKVVGELRPGHLRGSELPPVQPIPTVPAASSRVMQAAAQVPQAPVSPAPEIVAPQEEPKSVEVSIPLANGVGTGKIEMALNNDRISLVVRDAPISTVLGVLAQQHGLNIVTAEDVNGVISVTLHDVSLDSGLNAILRTNGYAWTRQDNIIVVTSITAKTNAPPTAQGREMRVFRLNYLSATDADMVIKQLLSPVGKSIVTTVDKEDQRRTREQLVVEDLPEYLCRVEEYLSHADQPPRQVLIEAHILQVALKDDTRHGVNIQQLLARVDNTDVTFKSAGLANANASPAFFLGIDGTDLDVLVELIKQTTDSKTLASPKVMVVNGQEAHMQTGAKLGYNTTTTTQTSTLQQVQFLDVGVILRVTPTITDDGQILMKVRPEVSDGLINAQTNLPESKTTEVETTVMLRDGRGMVIGGLIKEEDTENQAKLPIIGDMKYIGRLFQRRTYVRSRNEIIVVLVPRLVPLNSPASEREDIEIARATTPLTGPHLERVDRRPVEPELPDAIRNPRTIFPRRVPQVLKGPQGRYGVAKRYHYPSADGDAYQRGMQPRDATILEGPQPGGEFCPPPGGMYCPPEVVPTVPERVNN
jgi:type II secretory pathway component GspD/PulD (secretin)